MKTLLMIAGTIVFGYFSFRLMYAAAETWLEQKWLAANKESFKPQRCDACGDRPATIETTITFSNRQLKFHACEECSLRMRRMVWKTDNTGCSKGIKN